MWKVVEKCPRIEVNEIGEVRYRDTRKYNRNYGSCIEKSRKYGCKAVIATNKKTGEEQHFWSTAEASRQLKCDPNVITRCLIGKRASAQGFYWRFAEGVS